LHISTLADIDDITPHIPAILEFIGGALSPSPDTNKLLVHCAIGINRSPSAIIAYLCSTQNINATQALKIVKHKKPDVRPSKLFLAQVDRYFGRGNEREPDPMVGFHERLRRRK
ncbi:protein-tyrosine phosphatase-like protein, partial [Tricladium varicosporioides]